MAASGHCGRVGGSGVNGHPKVLGKIGSCAFFLAAAVLMSSCGFLAGTPAQTVVFSGGPAGFGMDTSNRAGLGRPNRILVDAPTWMAVEGDAGH